MFSPPPAADAENLWSRETSDQIRWLFSTHGKTSRYRSPSLIFIEATDKLTSCMRHQIVAWPEDRKCERSWLLEKIAGATGVIVMLSDEVQVDFVLSPSRR